MLYYFDFNWFYSVVDYSLMILGLYDLYFIVFLVISVFLLYLLILSSTIFLGLLILLTLFIIQIVLLYTVCQYLFALFLLGVYVGAILVFFIFVVMSFIFFGKSYILTSRLWKFFMVFFIALVIFIGCVLYQISGDDSYFYVHNTYSYNYRSIDELQSVGLLLFDIDMMYIVIIISLLLLVALVGSITFNASSLVRYVSSFYKKD